jgi:hypothetical protein
LQRWVEYDRKKRAVHSAGTVLDWWDINGSGCALLFPEQVRRVRGRYRMVRIIVD